MRLPTALAQFTLQLQADGRSPHTIAQYHRHVRLLEHWGADEGLGWEVSAFDHQALARFLCSPVAQRRADGRPRKATSMNALRSSLRGFFGYLHRAGILPADPSRLVRRSHASPPPPRSLSAPEFERLLAALADDGSFETSRDRALFTLLLRTGLRLGSALALEVGDVDFEAGEIRFREGKWARGGVAYLDRRTAAELKAMVGERSDGALFTSALGRRLSARQVERRFDAALRRAGIRRAYTPHSLRHTFAQRLYDRTRDLLVVKRALGHRSLTAALAYAHASQEDLRRAVVGDPTESAALGAG